MRKERSTAWVIHFLSWTVVIATDVNVAPMAHGNVLETKPKTLAVVGRTGIEPLITIAPEFIHQITKVSYLTFFSDSNNFCNYQVIFYSYFCNIYWKYICAMGFSSSNIFSSKTIFIHLWQYDEKNGRLAFLVKSLLQMMKRFLLFFFFQFSIEIFFFFLASFSS